MSIKLLKQGLNGHKPLEPMWRQQPLKDSYDVVIIGGGAHGLACAYYLAKHHKITNVAVLEKAYLGSGGSGRCTSGAADRRRRAAAGGAGRSGLNCMAGAAPSPMTAHGQELHPCADAPARGLAARQLAVRAAAPFAGQGSRSAAMGWPRPCVASG